MYIALMSLTIFFLLGTNFSYSYDFTMGHTNANDLILRGDNCEQLKAQHLAICKWKDNLGEVYSRPEIKCFDDHKAKYKVIIKNCMPKFTKLHHRKNLYKSGANCWGTALNFKGFSLKPRFVWQNEMRYFLESPICRKLNPGEKKKPGDIIGTFGPEYMFDYDEKTKGIDFWQALYPGRYQESTKVTGYTGFHNFIHAETYISDKLTFAKDSPLYDDRFNFHHMSEVVGRPKNKNCAENQEQELHFREYRKKPKSIRNTECPYLSLAFRCGNFKEYFNRKDLSPLKKTLLQDINQLKAEYLELFKLLTVKGYKISYDQIDSILEQVDEISDKVLDELKKQPKDKDLEILLTLKYFSAHGLRKALELADLAPATERL